MQVDVTLMITSVGSSIFGSGTVSHRTSLLPCQTSAFIANSCLWWFGVFQTAVPSKSGLLVWAAAQTTSRMATGATAIAAWTARSRSSWVPLA